MTRFFRGLLILGLLVGVAAASSGRLNDLLPVDLPSPTQVAAAAPRLIASADDDVSANIEQVIQRSNDEQVQAIAARDPSAMADTVTSDHFNELVQINQDLLDNGVTAIQLVRLDWGPITVNGSSATATTFETWTSNFNDGSTSRSRDRNDYTLTLDNGVWKISADDHPGQSSSAGNPPPRVEPVPGIPDNQNTSHNWSGYAATGGSYTAVSGTWAVPQFNGNDQSFGVDASWVGIGGVRSRDLIQAGTQQTISGGGRTQYQAWVEMLPQSSRQIPLSVHPGDSISVSITEQSPDNWLVEFTNNTTGKSYQETEQYRSSHSSAEWVEEAPSGGRGGVLPLSNFGTIEFTGATAVKNDETVNVATSGARAITMIGGNEQALAVPSDIGADGASFSVARTDAPATTAAPRFRGFGGN
jgi:hypothetical protein